MTDKKDEKSVKPPDTSIKKEGVTSTFSAATGEPGKYGGEDIEDVKSSTGSDEDKIADRLNDEPAGNE